MRLSYKFSLLVFLIVVSILRRKRTKERRKVLIVGDAKSGKSSLVDMLSASHNSQPVDDGLCQMVDIAVDLNKDTELEVEHLIITEYKQPIQEIMQSKRLSSDLKNAVCIVCMIDGTSFSAVPIAFFLNEMMKNPFFIANPLPILIAVNKSDLRKCIHNTNAYKLIEEEVGRMNAIEGYTFKDYSPCTIYSCNISIASESYKIIEEFITACLQ